jgi:polyhydroxyalkanoate synthesis regulator phasin
VRDLIEAAQADAVAAEVEVEALEERVEELQETVKQLRAKTDNPSRVQFDRLRMAPAEHAPNLVNLLGKKGEMYSQEIVELGFRLMATCLSWDAAQRRAAHWSDREGITILKLESWFSSCS